MGVECPISLGMSDSGSHTAVGAVDTQPKRVVQAPSSQIRTRERMPFGKYELLSRLRVGGMAEVWRARETEPPGRVVALKRILPSFTDEADYVAMFIDEARLGMRLSHPGIVGAYELGCVEDEHYIALELVEGRDLASLIRWARCLRDTSLAKRSDAANFSARRTVSWGCMTSSCGTIPMR